jgi:hypothetical protein
LNPFSNMPFHSQFTLFECIAGMNIMHYHPARQQDMEYGVYFEFVL